MLGLLLNSLLLDLLVLSAKSAGSDAIALDGPPLILHSRCGSFLDLEDVLYATQSAAQSASLLLALLPVLALLSVLTLLAIGLVLLRTVGTCEQIWMSKRFIIKIQIFIS